MFARGALDEFLVRSMERIASLESNDVLPAKRLETRPHFVRTQSQIREICVLHGLHGRDSASRSSDRTPDDFLHIRMRFIRKTEQSAGFRVRIDVENILDIEDGEYVTLRMNEGNPRA